MVAATTAQGAVGAVTAYVAYDPDVIPDVLQVGYDVLTGNLDDATYNAAAAALPNVTAI